jgi:hypothetical protein
MKKAVLILLMLIVVQAAAAGAAPLRVYVGGVSAVGVANRDEAQMTIKTLLTSRLNRGQVTVVANAAEAEAVVTISYVVAGQIFSLDAVASTGGRAVASVFVEGDHLGDLIPAVGKLSEKLVVELSKIQAELPVTSALPAPPAVAAKDTTAGQSRSPAGEIVPINEKTMGSRNSWRSQPVSGAINLITAGGINSDGSRDIFLADNHILYRYRKGNDLRLISEVELKVFEKIISLDAIDVGNGSLELYMTVVSNEQLSSKVWQIKGDSMQLVADGLPYFFRVLPLPGSSRKLYAQKSGGEQVFTGDVFEAARQGAEIKLINPIRLPRTATIYTFNQFVDASGRRRTVVLSSDNKLIVFDSDQHEIWRSSETYGGSELFLEKLAAANGSGSGTSRIYMNQRIQVTPQGDVLVGKNESLWFLGKKGDYSNGSVYCLAWSGDHLEGKWHTRIAENYMPDYYYDDKLKELLQLELVSRPHILSRGTSVLTIRKID